VTVPLLLLHRLFGTAYRRTYGHPHRCSCSDVGSSLSFSSFLWAQDTLRDFYSLAVTWPCSFFWLYVTLIEIRLLLLLLLLSVQCPFTVRSTDALRLFVHRARTETAKRAFSVAALNVWNSLPIDIRNTSSLSTFRNKLKTHFFTAAYTWRDIPTTAPLYLVPRQTPRCSTNMVLC